MYKMEKKTTYLTGVCVCLCMREKETERDNKKYLAKHNPEEMLRKC